MDPEGGPDWYPASTTARLVRSLEVLIRNRPARSQTGLGDQTKVVWVSTLPHITGMKSDQAASTSPKPSPG